MNELERGIILNPRYHKDLRGLSYFFCTNLGRAREYIANMEHPLIIKNTIIRHAYCDAIFTAMVSKDFELERILYGQPDLKSLTGSKRLTKTYEQVWKSSDAHKLLTRHLVYQVITNENLLSELREGLKRIAKEAMAQQEK